MNSIHKHREEKQNEAKSKKDQRLDDLRQILNQPWGRRYMDGLLEYHCVFLSIPGGNNSERDKRLGMREAGLRIMADIAEARPDLLKLKLSD
tara:strand:+ start:348 stop:623 length:276 start_codon:yes stop_codon:yes gene_type:complete